MEIHKLLDKEFKIIVLKMLRELQENTGKQFNEIRETIQEWNDKFHKEKTKKENQTEILELKNTMNEMQNAIESINDQQNGAIRRKKSVNSETGTLKLPSQRTTKEKE